MNQIDFEEQLAVVTGGAQSSMQLVDTTDLDGLDEAQKATCPGDAQPIDGTYFREVDPYFQGRPMVRKFRPEVTPVGASGS